MCVCVCGGGAGCRPHVCNRRGFRLVVIAHDYRDVPKLSALFKLEPLRNVHLGLSRLLIQCVIECKSLEWPLDRY